ncbi:hypothetical protein ACWGDS_25970 [Streptomyces sp. NPDC055059]
MTDTRPGPDELRLRSVLRKHGVGPDAEEAPLPAAPSGGLPDGFDRAPDPDWFMRLYGPDGESPIEPDTSPDPDPDPADDDPEPEPAALPAKAKGERRAVWATPRSSLLDALDHTPRRAQWLAYHLTAAAAGWRLGIVDWATGTADWFAAGHWTSSTAWVVYGLGACAVALYRRSRPWIWPAAWAAAIPASSVVVGVLLHGTGA